MTTTTTTFTISEPLSKKSIIHRLFEAGHINFDEMWLLILDEPETKLVPMPNPYPYPVEPYNPNDYLWTITTSDGQ